jgi:murein DD-endopeptidase MepM/ murein hydrolase activator NlpD
MDMATSISNGFRHPLGGGYLTEDDSTSYLGHDEGFYTDPSTGITYHGFYVPTGANFNDLVFINGHYSYHLGEDWNGNGGGNTDLGVPVYAISNGQVTQVGLATDSDTGPALGNYVAIRHDLTTPITINGITTSQIVSLYAHLEFTPTVSVGDIVTIGQQIGQLGATGDAGFAHLHFEIRLGTQFRDADGYNPNGAPSGWVDPTDFINAHRTVDTPFQNVNPDFNGDGFSDILWQNNNGQVYEWQLNGTSIIGSGFVGNNNDPSWHVVGL